MPCIGHIRSGMPEYIFIHRKIIKLILYLLSDGCWNLIKCQFECLKQLRVLVHVLLFYKEFLWELDFLREEYNVILHTMLLNGLIKHTKSA